MSKFVKTVKAYQDWWLCRDWSVKRRSLKMTTHFIRSQPVIPVSLLSIIITWISWLFLLSPEYAISNLLAHWQITVTMLFGSMVAGGTSMGGGAVAFPVLTKVLEISPHDAKIFSLAIQTVGMGAASLTIIAMGTQLPWRFICLASLGGIPGIWLSSAILSPLVPPHITRFSFTMMISSLAIILLVFNRAQNARNFMIHLWSRQEKLITMLAGLFGGISSGLVGTGMDICLFAVMVLLFQLCEKISTPTSVVLMAINAGIGFFLHRFVIGDFVEPIQSYWLAAVPIVVVGAPAGAIICSLLNRQTIVGILITLMGLELSTSLFLIPLHFSTIVSGCLVFTAFCAAYYWMYRTKLT